MQSIPKRLISNEDKVNLIKSEFCENCKLTRRNKIETIYTPGGEIDPNIWQKNDIFGLSVNVNLCNIKTLPIDSEQDDVNITPIEAQDKHFDSNSQLKDYNFDKIKSQKQDTPIVFMIIKEILKINGSYPFGKGTKKEKTYLFKLDVVYVPMILNCFHFQIEVLSNRVVRS